MDAGDPADPSGVERRRESRTPCAMPARLVRLADSSGELNVMIENRSQRGVAIRVQTGLALSEPVRIETHNEVLLGEVCHCEPAGSGFLIGVHIEHSIRHLDVLFQLNQALSAELSPPSGGSDDKVTDSLHHRQNQDGQ